MKSQKNVDNVRCGDKRRVRALLAASAASVMLFLLFGEGGWLGRRSLSDRGIPDAVSSRTVNGECYLDVVANTDRIEGGGVCPYSGADVQGQFISFNEAVYGPGRLSVQSGDQGLSAARGYQYRAAGVRDPV